MPMEIFEKVLGKIDEEYPFSLLPKLILALLVATGLCTGIIGILFIWYRRKSSFTLSTMGNILKLIPSLKEKIPTLDSLLPILSEHKPQNAKNALPTVAVPQQSQTPLDELILSPILVPKLQMAKPLPAIPYCTTPMDPQSSTSTITDYKSGQLLLEMFNRAVADLNDKGVINMKKYKNIFTSLHPKNMNPHELVSLVGPVNNFAVSSVLMHLAQILLQDGHTLPPHLFMDVLTEKTQTLLEFIRIRHVGPLHDSQHKSPISYFAST